MQIGNYECRLFLPMLIHVLFTARKQLNFKYETQINTDVWTSPSRYIHFSLRNMKVCLVYLLPPAIEVWGKVIFSVACVKNSVHGRGGLPMCMLGYHPLGRDPLRSRTPPSRHPHPPRTRHHPGTRHAGRYGQQAGGMHSTGMQSFFLLLSLFLSYGALAFEFLHATLFSINYY